MCLRFQFCTHQRVCILHFQKKSNSLYPIPHIMIFSRSIVYKYVIVESNVFRMLSDFFTSNIASPALHFPPIRGLFPPYLSLLYPGKRFVCKIFPIINQGCAREEGDFSINLTTKDRQNRTHTCFRILFEGGSTGQHLPAHSSLYNLYCVRSWSSLSSTEQTNAKP
jgi:hypothetical protein